MGLFGTLFSGTLFGFSKSFYWMLLSRGLKCVAILPLSLCLLALALTPLHFPVEHYAEI